MNQDITQKTILCFRNASDDIKTLKATFHVLLLSPQAEYVSFLPSEPFQVWQFEKRRRLRIGIFLNI